MGGRRLQSGGDSGRQGVRPRGRACRSAGRSGCSQTCLGGGLHYEWEVDDDGLGDADLDEILMAVADELADAIALADITVATEAIMAEIAPASSLLGSE